MQWEVLWGVIIVGVLVFIFPQLLKDVKTKKGRVLSVLGLVAILSLSFLMTKTLIDSRDAVVKAPSPWTILREERTWVGGSTVTLTTLKDELTGNCYLQASTGNGWGGTTPSLTSIECPE